MRARAAAVRPRRLAVAGWVLLLSGVLLWPITRPGYLLGHDLVFTPQQPLNLPALGLGTSAPRAVPVDALVALAEHVVDGAVVGRLAVLLPLLAAGAGVALLLGGESGWAQGAAAGAAVWNPYVVERLALGQWALLWCYAALPWLVVAMARGRGRSGWAGRAAALGAASITPTGGLVAAGSAVALAVGLRRPRREVLTTVALAAVLQLPWLVPALVSSSSSTSDPAGVAAFSARAEHPGGTVLTLLGGGGVWDSEVVPGSRGGVLPWLWLLVLVAAASYGTRPLIQLLGGRVVRTLAVLAAVGFLLAVVPSAPGGDWLVRTAVEHLPGAGLVRDAQKWLLPLVFLETLLIGAAAGRLLGRVAERPARIPIGVAALLLPVIALPDAAATLRPTLDPVRYPVDWAAVIALARDGDAAVLPWGSYRLFRWAPGRSVLDPAPRLLTVPTVVDDRLAVSGRVLGGEDERAAQVGRALAHGTGLATALARAGVRWVVVEHGTPGPVPILRELVPVRPGREVSLYRVPGTVAEVRPSAGRIAAVVVADLLAVAVLLGLVAAWVVGTTRRKSQPEAQRPLL